MSDPGHIGALADLEARGAGPTGGHTQGYRWRTILAAFLVLILIGFALYRFMWPAFYDGPVRWSSDFSTLTLLDSGKTLEVTDATLIEHGQLNVELLRTELFASGAATEYRAHVVWRPFLNPSKKGTADGFAQSIDSQ